MAATVAAAITLAAAVLKESRASKLLKASMKKVARKHKER